MWPSGEGGAVPAHVGGVHVVVVDVDPIRADSQAIGWQAIEQEAAQQLAVEAVLRASDLADAVQTAERARLTVAAEGHELVWDHVHRDALGRLAGCLRQLLSERTRKGVRPARRSEGRWCSPRTSACWRKKRPGPVHGN